MRFPEWAQVVRRAWRFGGALGFKSFGVWGLGVRAVSASELEGFVGLRD